MIREELDGTITVVASSFQGRRFNRPNDVVVKSDGAIYFTDPWTGNALPDQTDLNFAGVYRVSPDLGTLTLLVNDFIIPNGIAFSPDESVLYVNDLPGATISARSSSRPTAPWRARPTRFSPTLAAPSWVYRMA